MTHEVKGALGTSGELAEVQGRFPHRRGQFQLRHWRRAGGAAQHEDGLRRQPDRQWLAGQCGLILYFVFPIAL